MAVSLNIVEIMTPLLRAMVDHPDDLLASLEGDTLCVISHPLDVPKLIGRDGRTARALRVLLLAIGRARGSNIKLNISQTDSFDGATELPERH